VDFSIDAITDKFKNPTFLLLAVGVGGVGLYSLLSSSNQSTSSDDEEAQKTVIYQSEGGFTPEDIQNYTENSYYALAETFGTGLESLGNALIEAQQEGFSNIQQILSNSNVNDNAIIDDDTTDANSSSSTSSSSSSSSSSSTKKSTSSSTKKYFTVGTWGKDSIYETTLSGIAVKFKTTVSNLLKLNPSIKNPDLIYAGQKLRVA
jgi:LysM repeat protein